MTGNNRTIISQFLLLGLPIPPEHQHLFYALFLAMYLTTVLGNLIIIILILLDSHLHTPMYLFLSNLSFSDLCFSSVTMPKLLQNMQSQDLSIPYAGCLAQIYFFLFFGDLGNFLLVAMAYDHYVAICFPLHYTSIMNPKLCVSLVMLSWVLTTFHAMLHTLLMVQSTQTIHKAFSTCGSHLSVVSLFYGTVIGVYLCPPANNSTVKETIMTMMYTVVTPMLNPFIYSLRNKDIKEALIRVFCNKKIFL
ncbi:hypothetical protein A6R68_21841 [Neotoma lepida]|uniref:G-protein coupled receptors family 1 profile domain-containing protein n=1 Tax=Neotoma lepida TaxID=56216 RepID=A0A1A6HNY6_NEOLE|nr:hypothetical protein A6R68_21841 [Neotoma lepida]